MNQLNRRYLVLPILYWLLFCSFTTADSIARDNLLIENITLISPERNLPLNAAYVRVENGIITEVSAAPIKRQAGTAIVDGKGKFLIPGLMDSHVHVSNMPGLKFGEENSPHLQELQRLFEQQQPKNYLYFGVTQILDPSNSPAAIERFKSVAVKPELFHCGAAPILHGYPTVFMDKPLRHKTFARFIYQPIEGESPPAEVDLSSHTPEAVVKQIADSGAICVKVFLEDGFGSQSHWPNIAPELLQRVSQAAKKHGLLLMAHANAIDMQSIAQQVNVDIIAHGMWNWNHLDGKPGLPIEIKKILDKIIEQKQVFQPTFGVMDSLKGVTIPNVLRDPLYRKVIPKKTFDWYHTEEGQWFKQEMLTDFGGLPLDKIHRRQDLVISQGERVVRYLNQQNHPLVLASDTPPAPTFFAQPGYSAYKEILHLNKIGMSLNKILATATINNAEAFGIASKYGTIEPGKVANLLVLNEDPLKTVTAYNSIEYVIINGQPILRELLKAK